MHSSILPAPYFTSNKEDLLGIVKYAFSLSKIYMLQDIKAGDCVRLVMLHIKKNANS